MNRRALMTGLVGVIAGGGATRVPLEMWPIQPEWVAREYRSRDGFGWFTARVERFRFAGNAERARQLAVREPMLVDSMSEFYVSNPQAVDIPMSLQVLPGSVARYDTLAGEAAVRGNILIGAFRRNDIVWTLQAPPDSVDLLISLAEVVTSRKPADRMIGEDQKGFHPGGLWELLPLLDDFPNVAVITEESTPDETWTYDT